MISILHKHGITIDQVTKPETLIKLRTAYTDLLKRFNLARENATPKTSTKIDDLVKEYEKNEDLTKLRDQFFDALREMVYELVNDDLAVSILLPDVLTDMRKEVLLERDYFIKKHVDPNAVADANPLESLKQELVETRNTINNVYGLAKSELPAVIDGFPVVEKQGELIPDLPDLPRGKIAGANNSPSGPYAKLYHLKLFWNDEPLPADMMLLDVAHEIVSDKDFRISSAQIIREVNNSGQKATEGWEMTFPTGTLKAVNPERKPKTDDED